MHERVSATMVIYVRQTEHGPQYAPVFIHSFKFYKSTVISPTSTADKLRFYRQKKSLLQRDVADYVGIDRSTYINYESNSQQGYSFNHLSKIALLLDVTLDDLLDEYNRFVYAQGQNLKAMRKRQGMTQAVFAGLMGVSIAAVKKWEQETVSMSRNKWHRLLQIGG